MSYWSLMVGELGQDDEPVFNATRKLSDDEFQRLSAANELFRRILGQMTWSVLQHNYMRFVLLEQQLRQDITSRTTTKPLPTDGFQIAIVASIVNFLAAMRMFLDQVQTELKRLDGTDNGRRFSAWKSVCSSEYDDYFAYRFLYRFRNYVLHVGLPLSACDISVSLKDADELKRRAISGEPLTDNLGDSPEVVVQILLGESPSDLLKNYDEWSTVKTDIESLTTEIDLAEQIHVGMECLTRIKEAYLAQFQVELLRGVNDFKAIVGSHTDYQSRPCLAQIPEDTSASVVLDMTMIDLEFERFLQAEQFLAGMAFQKS